LIMVSMQNDGKKEYNYSIVPLGSPGMARLTMCAINVDGTPNRQVSMIIGGLSQIPDGNACQSRDFSLDSIVTTNVNSRGSSKIISPSLEEMIELFITMDGNQRHVFVVGTLEELQSNPSGIPPISIFSAPIVDVIDCTSLKSAAVSALNAWVSNPLSSAKSNALNAISKWAEAC